MSYVQYFHHSDEQYLHHSDEQVRVGKYLGVLETLPPKAPEVLIVDILQLLYYLCGHIEAVHQISLHLPMILTKSMSLTSIIMSLPRMTRGCSVLMKSSYELLITTSLPKRDTIILKSRNNK